MRSYLLALGLLFVMGSLAQDSLLPTGLFEEYLPRHSFRTTSFTGWSFGGDTVIMDDFIRLTPTEKGRKGWLWNSFPNSYSDWLVLTELRVSPNPDSPARLGADGMAVWFTKERSQPGPIFGNKDQFTGLGVILDTFDNDNKRDNPRIQIVYNDGSRSYDKNQDGRNIELASCQVNFRGQVPIKLKVAYFNKRLQVSYDTSGQVFEEHRKWTVCNTEPLYLEVPRLGYFGVTAETGDLFDNHDVYSFVTYRLAMQDPNINTRAHVYGEDQDRETQQAAERQRELDRIKTSNACNRTALNKSWRLNKRSNVKRNKTALVPLKSNKTNNNSNSNNITNKTINNNSSTTNSSNTIRKPINNSNKTLARTPRWRTNSTR
jgi:mannose-binding lectin 1